VSTDSQANILIGKKETVKERVTALNVEDSGLHNTEKYSTLSGCWSSLRSGRFNHVDGIFKGISSHRLKFPHGRYRSAMSFSLAQHGNPPAPGVFFSHVIRG
jgi:hypothetical protein